MSDKYQELQKKLGEAAAEGRFEDAAVIRQEIKDTWAKDPDNKDAQNQEKSK